MHTYIQTCMHACMNMQRKTILAYKHSLHENIHTYIFTHIHTYTPAQACIHDMHTCMRECIHKPRHTYFQYIHAWLCIVTNTQIHT